MAGVESRAFYPAPSQAELDARYIRRFVNGVETGGTAEFTDVVGAAQRALFGTNQVYAGFAPADIAGGLVRPGPGSFVREAERIYRAGGSPLLSFVRVNGTYLAPTEPAANDVLGDISGNGYISSLNDIRGGAGVRFIARNAWSATDRSSFVRIIGVATGSTSILSVLEVEPTATAVAEVFSPLATLRIRPTTSGQLRNPAGTATVVEWNATGLGLFGVAPVARSAEIPDAAGGATVDAEARAAINALLAYLRLRGDVTP